MSAPAEAAEPRPGALRLVGGALVMLLCAALLDLWFCWPAGAEMDAYEFLVYLVVIGTFTVLWYPVLLLAFPRLQRYGFITGFLTAVLVDISIAVLSAVVYWGASSHSGSPSANAILGLELAYAFAYLGIFLMFVSWRALLVYMAGGWVAQRVMRMARGRP
jgi:hypothetical protein